MVGSGGEEIEVAVAEEEAGAEGEYKPSRWSSRRRA